MRNEVGSLSAGPTLHSPQVKHPAGAVCGVEATDGGKRGVGVVQA